MHLSRHRTRLHPPRLRHPRLWCQVHHITDWANGGQTNIDEETLACGPHNRLINHNGWTTHKRNNGTTEWTPPPHQDHGQPRANTYHHPERHLQDDDDEDDDP